MSADNVLTVILGGGAGTRLFPLTKDRAKPSVPLAGKFRLIDIPISNSLHSQMEKIYVLTQFNSVSLNRHVAQTYRFDSYRRGFVQVLAAQQTLTSEAWYQGTADAVRQNRSYITDSHDAGDYVLILAGDHLYRMDYRKMLDVHVQSKADITVSVIPVHRDIISGLGVLKTDSDGRIIDFIEKPLTDEYQTRMQLDEAVFKSHGIEPEGRTHIASMGIYIFNRDVLAKALSDATNVDFGKDILPKSIETKRVVAYFFDGYWEDIGTIGAFYRANLGLTDEVPQFNFYEPEAPIYTHRRHLPSTKVNSSHVRSSILCEGSIIDHSEIDRSIIGIRSVVSEGARIYRSVVMGADYYETEVHKQKSAAADIPNIGIGKKCIIEGAIIDKNARIGDDSIIVNGLNKDHYDSDDFYIRDGIVIIPKNAVIPPGTRI
jgi:glucose-1-phosphate adenylyltransferase